MKKMTEQHLINAFGGESQAHIEKAKVAVDNNSDVELGPVQVCKSCGYTLEGDAPDKCPLCTAKREEFVAFQ